MALILGLVHAPLPQPDFHNIRHHDGPGEVCEHHDHLLRWHPGAGQASDVAVLHWHWFLPTAAPFDLASEQAGPAVHAHIVDWQASSWEDGPSLSRGPTAPLRGATAPEVAPVLASLNLSGPAITAIAGLNAARVHAFSATFAPSMPLGCLFQRWTC